MYLCVECFAETFKLRIEIVAKLFNLLLKHGLDLLVTKIFFFALSLWQVVSHRAEISFKHLLLLLQVGDSLFKLNSLFWEYVSRELLCFLDG